MPLASLLSIIPWPAPSYDNLKTAAGRERIDLVHLTIERCTLTNGVAPCTASSTCFNSWATCRDKPNYSATTFDAKFCTPASYVPDGYIPILQSAEQDSAELDPENGLGKRASVSLRFIDAPHDDIGYDPYLSTRTYDPMQQGTFWPKFRKRWPFYQGRKVVWYRGYVHSPFSLANCVAMEYVAEDLKGWGTGSVTLTAKDPLKLADNDRAEYPPRSTGVLLDALNSTGTHPHIDIITDRVTEYDIQSWEPSYSAVRIGDEIVKYTTVGSITGGVRLTGLTWGGFDQYETTRESHDEGDEVQKCAYFKAMRPIDVFQVLLEHGAGIDTAYIPYSDWLSEATTWIAGFRLTRLVTEPEGVRDTIKELVGQTSTWALWWDEETSTIQYRCVRPPDIDEIVDTITDDQHILQGSAKCTDQTDRLLNEVYVTMGQRDPTKKKDELGNYRAGFITVNTDSQGANEINGRRALTIWGRWHPTSNRAELQAVIDRMLLNRTYVPVRIEFDLDPKDDATQTGQFVRIDSAVDVDEFGAPEQMVYRVLKTRQERGRVKYTAIQAQSEMVGQFGRIAPNTFAAGTEYMDCAAADQEYYMFIATDAGYLDGGVAGKVLL